MSPRLPAHGAADPSSRWRPTRMVHWTAAAGATVLLGASAVAARSLGVDGEAQPPAPLGAQVVAAAAGPEVTPLAPLPTGSRPFPAAGGPRFDGHLPARATPEPPAGGDEPAPAPAPAPAPDRGLWDRLADCESGDWDRNGDPVPGTARWDLRPGEHVFEGGLQFHPDTWDGFAPSVLGAAPAAAYEATRAQQIAVAEAVLDAQGWGAWPACSRKLGLRG